MTNTKNQETSKTPIQPKVGQWAVYRDWAGIQCCEINIVRTEIVFVLGSNNDQWQKYIRDICQVFDTKEEAQIVAEKARKIRDAHQEKIIAIEKSISDLKDKRDQAVDEAMRSKP